MLAMQIAWGAAILAAILCVLGGMIEVIRGEWFAAALLIFIMAPVGYGQHVALGMAIDYAREGG
jgi:multisubunit Na+/H+ antiporter MnhG subunit